MDDIWFFGFFRVAIVGLIAAVLGLPQPFSMPPLPEDPALLRMVPADSVFAFAWSGAADADGHAMNRTEQLCAEPEVRQALTALRTAITRLFDPRASALARSGLDFVCAALQRPGCLFVRRLSANGTAGLEAGLAVKLENDLPKANVILSVLGLAARANSRGAEPHEDFEIDDLRFHALPTPATGPLVGWTDTDGWLLFAVGEDAAKAMVRGLRDQEQGLRGSVDGRRLLDATTVARPVTHTLARFDRILEIANAHLDAELTGLTQVFGLATARTAMATTGLDGDGFAVRMQLDMPERSGLLGALTHGEISQDALVTVPGDADLALLLHADPEQLEASLLRTLGAFAHRDLSDDYTSFQQRFSAHFGVDWRRDLLLPLDGNLTAWDAPSQGGFGITAATACLGLRDGKAFAAAWQKVFDRIGADVPSKEKQRAAAPGERLSRYSTFLETFTHEDRTVHWFDVLDRDVPFAPALAVCPTALVAGLTPQAVRSTIEALDVPNPDRSLARLPAFNRRGHATALLQFDARSLLQQSWPAIMIMLQTTAGEWQRNGVDFDLADVPRQQALLPHLDREIAVLEVNDHGVAYRRTGTLPVLDFLTLAAGGAVLATFAP